MGNGTAWPLSGLPITAIPLRYLNAGKPCGWLSDSLATNVAPKPAGNPLSCRLTSDSFGLRYRLLGGLVIKGDVGEYRANRPNARIFLVRPDTGGLLHQIQASGGIGFNF